MSPSQKSEINLVVTEVEDSVPFPDLRRFIPVVILIHHTAEDN